MCAVRMPTPGNSCPRFSRMTSSSIAKRRPPSSRGSATKRGSRSGTFTRANFVRPFVLDDDREVLAAIRDERKRMPGVERQRRQDGADIDVEVPREIRAVVVGVVGGIDDMRCARRASSRRSVSSQNCHSSSSIAVARSLARESAWSRRTMKNSSRLLAAIAEKLRALEQRMAGPGLLEHAIIEREPAEVAVEIERRIPQIGLRRRLRASWRADVERAGPSSGSCPAALP